MKKLLSYAGLAMVLAGISPQLPAADPAQSTQFVAKLVITTNENGKAETIAPTMVFRDGQEASFLRGGEIAVQDGTAKVIQFGIEAQIRVHEIAPDKFRVSLHAANASLDEPRDSNITVHETGARCALTVKPGEPIAIDLGPDRTMSLTITKRTF